MKRRKYQSVSPSTVLLMRQIIIGVMIASFLGMLLISIWYGTRIEAFTLQKITVEGGETISHEYIESMVRSGLEGSYLRFIPYTFAFTYPHDALVAKLDEIGRIKDFSLTRVSGQELRIEFTEYVPHALWCKDSTTEGCYFLDETGYSFAQAPSLSGGSFLRFVAIGRSPQEHTQAFSPDDYQKAYDLITRLREARWNIVKVELDAVGDAFLTIREGGEFKVSLKQSVDETMDNLLTVLGSETFAHIAAGKFEYIDLRFGSKVFVNEMTTIATSTEEHIPAETAVATTDPLPETETGAEATSSTPAVVDGPGEEAPVEIVSTEAGE